MGQILGLGSRFYLGCQIGPPYLLNIPKAVNPGFGGCRGSAESLNRPNDIVTGSQVEASKSVKQKDYIFGDLLGNQLFMLLST